ncbi:hypothetical protein B0H13DRAFT_1879569 [Mycena leptocephala]|nr:hypothetical protein B0H13DRAFT_1879569 [Mycena leptocephala]
MCSSGSWEFSEAYKTLEGWDEKTRGMGKSEFNLVQDIRLLHISHILRSFQEDHGTPMKHIKPSRDGTVGKGTQERAVSGLLFHSVPPAYSTYFEECSNGF